MKLSARETEVVRLICRGLSLKQIAGDLGMSPHTANTLIRRIRDKTGCHKAATLVMWAVTNEVVKIERGTHRTQGLAAVCAGAF